MNKKNFVVFALVLLLLPIFVSAQASTGILGGTEAEILKTVIDIINFQIPIVGATMYGYTLANSTVPLWLLAAMFGIVYSIIWLASGFVKLFTDNANRTPRIIFTIAVTLIIIFATPVILKILVLVRLFTALSVLAIMVLGVFIIWVLFKSGWASGASTNAESSKSLADAKRMAAEAARQNEQTKDYKHKTAMALNNGLHQQTAAIRQTRTSLQSVVNDVMAIKHAASFPPGAATTDKLIRDMNNISLNLGKLSSFATENDRLLSLMSSRNYVEKSANRLSSIGTTTRGLVDIKKKSDTETNDLGRTLTQMSGLIMRGINTDAVASKVIELGTVGVNVLQRMERDIVLEEQMINKI